MNVFFRRVIETAWAMRRKPPAYGFTEPLASLSFTEDEIAIDCGANLGDVTVPLAEKGAKVYAFEPNPYAFSELKRRTSKFPRVRCFNQGVLDRRDRLKLYLHQNASQNQMKWANGSSLLACKGNVDRNSSVEVEVIDLSEFIATLEGPIKLLKLDVEGVECAIINRLIDTGMTKRIAHILVETHDDKIPELRAETDALRKRIFAEGLTNIDLDWI